MGYLDGLGGFLKELFIALVSHIVADEFRAWSPKLWWYLVKLAIKTSPAERRERLDEEWRSHIEDTPGEIGKLVVAIGFVVAALKLSSAEGIDAVTDIVVALAKTVAYITSTGSAWLVMLAIAAVYKLSPAEAIRSHSRTLGDPMKNLSRLTSVYGDLLRLRYRVNRPFEESGDMFLLVGEAVVLMQASIRLKGKQRHLHLLEYLTLGLKDPKSRVASLVRVLPRGIVVVAVRLLRPSGYR